MTTLLARDRRASALTPFSLVLPLLLLGAAGCSGSDATEEDSTSEVAQAKPDSTAVDKDTDILETTLGAKKADPHAGHDHGPGEGHDDLSGLSAGPTFAGAGDQSVASGGGVSEGAKIEYTVGQENHHFGNVVEGATLDHTFDIRAGGTTDLIVRQVKPTCGCTIAKVLIHEDGEYVPYGFGDAVPPGTQLRIGATLNTKNKRGHQNSRINIFSNDPRGTIQLGLEADVEAFFTVQPKHVAFQRMTVGETQEHMVKINTSKAQKVQLELVNPDTIPAGMRAELKAIEPDEEGAANRWDFVVGLGPDTREGNVGHTFSFRSNREIQGAKALPDGTQPVYELSVSSVGQVTGLISYNPAYVAMGLVRPGQVVSRTVRVASYDDEFEFGELNVTFVGAKEETWEHAERFSAVVRPVENENAVDVEVRLDGLPDTLTGSFRGRALIEVGHPSTPTIEMPITGVCRGGSRRSSPNKPASATGITSKKGSGQGK